MHIGEGEEALGMKSVGSTIGFVTIVEDDSALYERILCVIGSFSTGLT